MVKLNSSLLFFNLFFKGSFPNVDDIIFGYFFIEQSFERLETLFAIVGCVCSLGVSGPKFECQLFSASP